METITHFKLRTLLKDIAFEQIKEGHSFNLLKNLELEINLLGIKDNPYKIARYIYIRLGELFEYDPYSEYASEEKKNILKAKKIDIRNVKSFQFICDSYAYMYAELLNYFGISAKVVDTKEHVYVIYTIEEKMYLADLTSGNEDITRIKFGLKPIYNRQIHPIAPKEDHTFDEIDQEIYVNGVTTEEALDTLKIILMRKKIHQRWSQEEYIYHVFKVIESIMNFDRNAIGFVSGVTYIYYLLNFFIENYDICHTHFLNQNDGLEMELFYTKIDNNIFYFKYQKTIDGFYKLKEISEKQLSEIINEKKLKLVK